MEKLSKQSIKEYFVEKSNALPLTTLNSLFKRSDISFEIIGDNREVNLSLKVPLNSYNQPSRKNLNFSVLEKSVMILVVAESGFTVFSYIFIPNKEFDEQLIGGFLTAVNALGSEVFIGSGKIERIVYKEFNLIFRSNDPITFCYVFKGQNASVSKKLDQFMHEIISYRKLWDQLLCSSKTGMSLSSSSKLKMEEFSKKHFSPFFSRLKES